ncbi:MAG TPA: imidazolonepropionase [Bacteroidales bacterium]|nr:MAG: imidazolonepropionase [Bacteroidetes bacterium GWE2_42_24]OFY30935.1 MAG: imidazolonepropionase [Bacteroidetes bacterium GWF2_43_11]HBZ66435.1 imidazolonepropionase [Bacteroidales bacterium]
MKILIRNIGLLVNTETVPVAFRAGREMSTLHNIENAWLLTDEDRIAGFGPMSTIETILPGLDEEDNFIEIDATGRLVFPSFCDSHTHLVYAGSREIEYVDKIKGLSYEEIFERGGGILNSARLLHEASEEELVEQALDRLNEMLMYGTGAVEIKSGYGLSTEDELKMLRVIKKLKDISPLSIKATFLGAHAVPDEYKGRRQEYVNMIINEMIPMVAAEELADYIDVFCDKGFFTPEDTDRILMAGMKYGLRPKIHANELDYSGGIQVGVKYNALSVDHLEFTGDEEIAALKDTETMPTILPGAAFFLNMVHAPARKMIEAGLPVAFASDFNPGSSPSGNMQLIVSMACIQYRLLPEEAINATTLNTAYAMGLSDELGSVAVGKRANLFITIPVPNIEFIPYAFGSNKIERVILNGELY